MLHHPFNPRWFLHGSQARSLAPTDTVCSIRKEPTSQNPIERVAQTNVLKKGGSQNRGPLFGWFGFKGKPKGNHHCRRIRFPIIIRFERSCLRRSVWSSAFHVSYVAFTFPLASTATAALLSSATRRILPAWQCILWTRPTILQRNVTTALTMGLPQTGAQIPAFPFV